jgi:small subunit ribosomal protein S4
MGDPRRLKKKYSGPRHPWQKSRIEEQATLRKEYGYKSKTELWKIQSKLRNFRAQARKLIGLRTEQAEKEKKQLLLRLYRLGLVSKNANLDDVLDLTTKNLMNRRLQHVVLARNLSTTQRQARQFITHGHIAIDKKIITSPNYLVSKKEEEKITFSSRSSLSSASHKVRAMWREKLVKLKELKPKKEKKEKKKKAPKKDEK